MIGPSGSGKSSLVAAGVIPRLLSADMRAAGRRFAIRTIRPGDRLTQRLTNALECNASTLEGAAGRLAERADCDRLLVFIDQFEEIFTLADATEHGELAQMLRALRSDHRCHLIIALRADFYGALMSSELWPDLDGRFTRLDVAPLRGAALREAIEAPARSAGVYLERALVERLMNDAAAEPGALPLLQEALVLLWQRRNHRLLRLTNYEALGSDGRSGLSVALALRADTALRASDFTGEQRRLAQRIFLRLISFGEGRPDTRRQQPRTALTETCGGTAAVSPVIDRLIDERMLTSDATVGGEPLIDLAHEALIAGWPELQRWLRTRRNDELRRRRFEQRVADWIQRGRSNVGLFDAIELAEAEHWVKGETAHEVGYSKGLPLFLDASRRAIAEANRRRRRLARFAVTILVLFSIGISIGGLVIWRQRQATQLQFGLNEQELARSLIVDRRDSIEAVPHLARAVMLGVDSTVLRTILRSAKQYTWSTILRHEEPVYRAVFSFDGTRAATASADGTAHVWDTVTGQLIGHPFQHRDAVTDVAFSPDGARIVTASWDHTARVWKIATGESIGLLQHSGPVTSAAFSHDGTRIVTASDDGTVRVWDAATSRPLGLLKHDQAVNTATFSADGVRIVTASWDGTARVWDAATGHPLSDPLKHYILVFGATFSPDGTRVVTASKDGTARVWDAATGAPLGLPLHHDRAVLGAAFSPDGAWIVTASEDGTARVWDSVTGTPLGLPLKHDKAVLGAAFSPDGTRIATASEDGTARIWDAATGLPLGLPFLHDSAVLGIAFSPDGTRIATASSDGTARVWELIESGTLSSWVKRAMEWRTSFSGRWTPRH